MRVIDRVKGRYAAADREQGRATSGGEVMLRARLSNGTFILGLDAENVRRLKAGHPILVSLGQLGGTDDVPMHYACQVHWYMAITDTDHAYLAALIGNDDFRIFRLERDLDLERAMIERLRAFWQRVQDGMPPEAQTVEDLALLYGTGKSQSVVASPEVLQHAYEAREAKARIKFNEQELERHELAIKLAMGPADTLLGADGRPIVTWRSHPVRRFDQKEFGKLYPDLLEEFKRTSETRVLRIK